MLFPERFCSRLKWAIYDWIGSVSGRELVENHKLVRQIELLCKRLSAIPS